MIPRRPSSPLFPYTTLFRSRLTGRIAAVGADALDVDQLQTGERSSSVTGAARLTVAMSALLRSEEHTSELQSRGHLVCRLLLEKKKTKRKQIERIIKTLSRR